MVIIIFFFRCSSDEPSNNLHYESCVIEVVQKLSASHTSFVKTGLFPVECTFCCPLFLQNTGFMIGSICTDLFFVYEPDLFCLSSGAPDLRVSGGNALRVGLENCIQRSLVQGRLMVTH